MRVARQTGYETGGGVTIARCFTQAYSDAPPGVTVAPSFRQLSDRCEVRRRRPEAGARS